MIWSSHPSRFLLATGWFCFAAGLGLWASGCTPFQDGSIFTGTAAKKLPHMATPPGAIQLDIVFAERPSGDRLLGPQLWREVDQVGAVENETRSILEQNGFKVGVVGARPPEALQSLLGLTADVGGGHKPEDASKQMVVRHVMLRPGGTTEIQVSPCYASCAAEVRQLGETTRRDYEQARCVYRVTAEQVQNGWVRLNFVPQVQFGDKLLRHTVGESGWQFSNSQKMESFLPQQFSVTLSVGELVVLSARDLPASTQEAFNLGQLFFLGPTATDRQQQDHVDPQQALSSPFPIPIVEGPGKDLQRVLVIRLAEVRDSDDLYSKQP